MVCFSPCFFWCKCELFRFKMGFIVWLWKFSRFFTNEKGRTTKKIFGQQTMKSVSSEYIKGFLRCQSIDLFFYVRLRLVFFWQICFFYQSSSQSFSIKKSGENKIIFHKQNKQNIKWGTHMDTNHVQTQENTKQFFF